VRKRIFDLVVSALGLLAVAPVLATAAILIKLDSKGPVFFRQKRIGRGLQPFLIWKFRTMAHAACSGASITAGKDPRITRVGGLLRRAKIDELPQLWNVFVGDMSLVGPRPELPAYVRMFQSDFEEILQVRPGITDPASIKYRNESDLLGEASFPERFYLKEILPDKIRLAKEYVRDASFLLDMKIILETLWLVFDPSDEH
jgi:lipopolysaccharide/colanic/teichoic acid biosynthesis glycosyltransferase